MMAKRLDTWAHASRVQSDEETYDLERTVVGSVVAGVTADRCGQCGAWDRSVDPVAMGNWEIGDMEIVGSPFAWLVQSTTERNPPHGWAVHMFNGQNVRDAIPIYLKSEVDRLRDERDIHARWRKDMADKLDECERHRDALGKALNKATACGEMLASVVQGAKEEFVRVPYGASHEDVAAINDWHKMASEALAAWENKT